jgi:hypothetical protein
MTMWGVLTVMVFGCGFASGPNDRTPRRVEVAATHVVRDSWIDAASVGAPIYRIDGGPTSLPPLPAGKAIVIYGNGYAFATDDLADVQRWYGLLTYPVLDLSGFPSVSYVYEVEHVELVTEADGRNVLAVTVHEARTGCELPACDPIAQLPNYDKRYVVKPANAMGFGQGGKHA